MSITRRSLLGTSAAFGAGALVAGAPALGNGLPSWEDVRALFPLSRQRIHMSAMLITSHPEPVSRAIERHRRALDADPVQYLEENGTRLTEASRAAAADRLGIAPARVALTGSTTEGVGMIYTSLPLSEEHEALALERDYFVTHESLRLMAERTGARTRRIELPEGEPSPDALTESIAGAIGSRTRLVALTWVNSGTGLKLPIARVAERIAEINAAREEADAVLLGLDAVHGFAVEPDQLPSLGVDFLMAGCHKWLFGPRGTGIVGFSEGGLASVRPTIPSFDDSEIYSAWYVGRSPRGGANGRRMTPGGFKPFEHLWALADAFELHGTIGPQRIAARTQELAAMLKEELTALPGLSLMTPRAPELSSGIVAFRLDGHASEAVVAHLRERDIVASVAPYPSAAVRLTPSIRNNEEEVERAVQALRELA